MQCLSLFLCLLFSSIPLLADTVGWRHDGASRFPDAAPQTQWSKTERVVWATPLPAWSNAGPILVGEHIFVTAEPATLICLDRAGTILWQQNNAYDDMMTPEERAKLAEEREAVTPLLRTRDDSQRTLQNLRRQLREAEGTLRANPNDAVLKARVDTLTEETANINAKIRDVQQTIDTYTMAEKWRIPPTHPANGYASAVPLSDGQRVFVCFGNGIVASYTLDGTLLWRRLLQKPTHVEGHCASPQLVGNRLIIQFVDMFGLDPDTGEIRWQEKRPKFWGTPAPIRLGTYDGIFTDHGEIIDSATGKTLATTGMHMVYNSPLIIGDVAYCVSNDKARAFRFAIGADDIITVTRLWETSVNRDRYYASPLLHDGLLYVINQKGVLSVLDAVTGEIAYEFQRNLGGTCYSSPVLAGNVIIISGELGRAVVLKPGREYVEIGQATLESYRSTPVCDGPRMYIRTSARDSKLYCIGE